MSGGRDELRERDERRERERERECMWRERYERRERDERKEREMSGERERECVWRERDERRERDELRERDERRENESVWRLWSLPQLSAPDDLHRQVGLQSPLCSCGRNAHMRLGLPVCRSPPLHTHPHTHSQYRISSI